VKRKWLPALLLAAVAFAASAQTAETQLMEVQQSSGFVEVLLPDLGWRQAVVGRQVPADAVMTSWIDASAKVGYGDSVLTVQPLTHLKVLSVSSALIRLFLESGGVEIDAASMTYEIEFRGMVVRIEKGKAALSDGMLAVQSGSVVVNGAQARPLPVEAGRSLSLLSRPAGAVFRSGDR
jgi:hypothetical protein